MTVMTRTMQAVRRLSRLIGEWHRRSRTRRALARMSARMLVDVGLSPAAVARESRQPFWRPPGCELGLLCGGAPAVATPGPALPQAVRPAAILAAAIFPCRA